MRANLLIIIAGLVLLGAALIVLFSGCETVNLPTWSQPSTWAEEDPVGHHGTTDPLVDPDKPSFVDPVDGLPDTLVIVWKDSKITCGWKYWHLIYRLRLYATFSAAIQEKDELGLCVPTDGGFENGYDLLQAPVVLEAWADLREVCDGLVKYTSLQLQVWRVRASRSVLGRFGILENAEKMGITIED